MTFDEVCKPVTESLYFMFSTGPFEFYQAERKIPRYLVGIHTKMSNNGYIELVERTVTHARIWRLSDKGLKLIGKERG